MQAIESESIEMDRQIIKICVSCHVEGWHFEILQFCDIGNCAERAERRWMNFVTVM